MSSSKRSVNKTKKYSIKREVESEKLSFWERFLRSRQCLKQLLAKLAFALPNKLCHFVDSTLVLNDRLDWTKPEIIKLFEIFDSETSLKNKIACLYVRVTHNPRFIILFSHGNGNDLGDLCQSLLELGSNISCNIFSYDYSGYGLNSGKPSEKNLYADIDSTCNSLKTRYGLSLENVILYGFSLGSVPTIDLATKHSFRAVILHSPLMSLIRVLFPSIVKTWSIDSFPNIDKISKITSTVLVFHGTKDKLIGFSH
jgi:hypothetical protein